MKIHVIGTTLALATVSGASANIVEVFEDRPAWTLAAGPELAIEGFEGRDGVDQLGNPTIFDSGLQAQLLDGDVLARVEAGDPDNLNLHNTTDGGSQYLRFGRVGNFGDYVVQFRTSQATNAFGFDISDWEPEASSGRAGFEFRLNGQLQIGFDLPSDAGNLLGDDEPPLFIGFTTDFVFDEVRMFIDSFPAGPQADVTAFDQLVWAVPAPGTTALLAVGAVCLKRRR